MMRRPCAVVLVGVATVWGARADAECDPQTFELDTTYTSPKHYAEVQSVASPGSCCSLCADQAFSVALWNNMFQPQGSKSRTMDLNNPPHQHCPTDNEFLQ